MGEKALGWQIATHSFQHVGTGQKRWIIRFRPPFDPTTFFYDLDDTNPYYWRNLKSSQRRTGPPVSGPRGSFAPPAAADARRTEADVPGSWLA